MTENTKATTAPQGAPQVIAPQHPEFDERRFLRRTRLKSVVRAVIVTVLVIVALSCATAVGAFKWYTSILNQANRIDAYYPDLVAISTPNTRVMGPSITRWHFPGASNDYASYRLIGSRPMPAGVRSVDFDLWSAEFLRGYDERWTLSADRMFSGSDLVPELRFLYPRARAEGASEPSRREEVLSATEWQVQALAFHSETIGAMRRLTATPASCTAEVAFSFDRLMTLAQLQSLAGTSTTLAWGAVNVWNAQDAPITPPMNAGEIVGVPFTVPQEEADPAHPQTPQEAERNLTSLLRNISSHAMIGTADKTRASADFIDKHGIRYYGMVLTGPPAQMLRIAQDPRVTGVSYGLAVGPWE